MGFELGYQLTSLGRVSQSLTGEDAHKTLSLGGSKHVQAEPRGCSA